MPPRTRLSLDGQWFFSTNEIQATENCPRITVPSPWQADARFRDHIGAAWYQRDFDVPDGWLEPDRVVILGFGAVDYSAEVWLNGVRVGDHEGGYLPFELDVSSAARPGKNTLTVRVDDPLEIFPEIPHGKQSWYGLLSGIWQPVWIESRAANHIQRIKITPLADLVNLEITLSHALADGQTLHIELLDTDGQSVVREESASLIYQLPITDPQKWDIDSPNLYTLKVSSPYDELTETFGFRTIEAKNGQILLNGRPFYLRGALDQDYYPDQIYTPPSQEYIEDQFRKAKQMGLNCLRIHIKVADPRYYAAADKVGLLIWTELPNHTLLTGHAKRRARETLAGMVDRDGNHPSIGIWTIINESWGIDLTDPFQRAWLAETYLWLKELDPTRLIVGNSASWGNFHVATDIADFHIYYAMPDHQEQWQQWTEQYSDHPWWLFAHQYQDHKAWSEFLRDPWHTNERPLAPEVQRKGDEPLLISEFGNWGLPDISKLYEENNGEAPWWFDTGMEWGDGVVYPHGIEQRFRDYHLDRVFPSLAALTEASQHLQHEALKFEIENIRSHASIQGYVITEFTDLHWESNGLLDMYRNPKAHFTHLKKFNADDVLIPVWERLAIFSGEGCDWKILFSHYSSLEINEAILKWELQSDQFTQTDGERTFGVCKPYGVTELGMIRFEVPPVEQPTKARLLINLHNGEKPIATTEQDFHIFPGLPPLPLGEGRDVGIFSPEFQPILQRFGYRTVDDLSQADVAVVPILDDACRDFILRGGRVLFLAERDNALQTHIPGLGIESRKGTPWQGDWASSFGWHRFKNIPTGGVVDFAFAGLTPEHIIEGFAPRDFAKDVYAGLFVGWLHKPVSTIARRRAGKGEVLVSTFRLSGNLDKNPLARQLFSELIRLLEEIR